MGVGWCSGGCDGRWSHPALPWDQPCSCIWKDGWCLDTWRYWEWWKGQESILQGIVNMAKTWSRQCAIPISSLTREQLRDFMHHPLTLPFLHLSSQHCQELSPILNTQYLSIWVSVGTPRGRLWCPSHMGSDMLPTSKSPVEPTSHGLWRVYYLAMQYASSWI